MTSVVENIISKKDQFLSAFDNQVSSNNNDHINRISQEAKNALMQLSFPTSRSEAWKYTRVNKIINQTFRVVQSDKAIEKRRYHIPGLDAQEIVFVNGFFRPDLSELTESNDMDVLTMAQAIKKYPSKIEEHYGSIAKHKENIFTAINTAFHTDGIYINFKNAESKRIVNFIHIIDSEESIAQTRNLIIGERNSKGQVIQTFISNLEKPVFCNQLTEVIVKENAHLTIEKIQMESESSFHLSTEAVHQEKSSYFGINTFSITGGWIRNNLDIFSKGKATLTDLYGLYHPKLKQHVDNHTLVDHCDTDGESNELYKGLIYDQATGVFNGKVIVEIDAQRTNAYQQNANILMSDDASINSKPELEIYADDVKCSHGSTTGQFDEEAMFYLMARGIKRTNAKRLLTEAFLSEVVDHCEILAVRELVTNKL